MPFISPLPRKRAHESSRATLTPWSQQPKPEIPRPDELHCDGNMSRSFESTSTTKSGKALTKGQWKRRMSSFKSILGIGDKSVAETAVDHGAKPAQTQSCNPSDCPFMNTSGSTMWNLSTKIRLRAMEELPESPIPKMMCTESTNECTVTDEPAQELTLGLDPSNHTAVSEPKSPDVLRRSQSVQALQRVSQKLYQAFNSSTIVKRPDLRSRPSLQTLQTDVVGAESTFQSSSPSTCNGSSGSAKSCLASTPATSTPPTPESIAHHSNSDVAFLERSTLLTEGRVLTPIPETAHLQHPSIKTVESASTAKIFLETHFNNLLKLDTPRTRRRRQLELRLRENKLSSNVKNRVRKEWQRAESNNLRQLRVLKLSKNVESAARGINSRGFEVVSVLGKGSFGVVRLVRAKTSSDDKTDIHGFDNSNTASCRRSFPILRASARDLRGSTQRLRHDLSQPKKEVYAMKVIRKSDMIRNGQEGHLRAERDFLVAAEGSRWVIPLVASFQDPKHLYLVMKYCIGGDFLGLLIRKNTLSEEVTRWYIAEMILCVEEAHRLKWIHRDVKPDNFLIGMDGHLKISDFGLAFDGEWSHDQKFYYSCRHTLLDHLDISIDGDEQDLREQKEAQAQTCEVTAAEELRSKQREHHPWSSSSKDEPIGGEPILDWRNRSQRRYLARSVVGTSQYMAPEVIRGDLYDGRCDWWSIAVIMYECLYGYTPFACDDRHNTKLKILQHKKSLVFPRGEGLVHPSPEAVDLMMQMLVEKERRLCSRRYELNDFAKQIITSKSRRFAPDKNSRNYQGFFVYPCDAEDIKRHPFFKDMNWDEIPFRRPPYVPRVRDWDDTKYFEEEEPVSDIDTASTFEESTKAEVTLWTDTQIPAIQVSHHHQEDQHIIPSFALKLPGQSLHLPAAATQIAIQNNEFKNTVMKVSTDAGPTGGRCCSQAATLVERDVQLHHAVDRGVVETQKPKMKKRMELKRPRDKILRDPNVGRRALEIRKKGAFLGYEYRQPVSVQDILNRVLNNETAVVTGCAERPPVDTPLVAVVSEPIGWFGRRS